MRKTFFSILILSAAALIMLNSCASVPAGGGDGETNLNKLVSDACFEIVVKKSDIDSLTYEKELPWELVPFNIRNDKYYSIGTAFAVSKTELLTAFHVLELNRSSLILKDYFIRDKNNNVYEIDQIKAFNQAKDYVKFTAADKEFDKWFSLENEYVLNASVYSAGNAYGEGIILREGSLIGTIPEAENGKWDFLKSSSDVNSGNSGGPLLNADGKVIAIVTMKKDNIAYSLPVAEIETDGAGIFHQRMRFKFDLFPEKTEIEDFDRTVKLPRNYKEIKKYYSDEYEKYSSSKMDQLFKEKHDEIFPEGLSSKKALHENAAGRMPQVVYKDKSDLKWKISSLKTSQSILHDKGVLTYGQVLNKTYLMNLEKPETLSIAELNSNPEIIMDLILEGINIPRKIANQDIRIISLGKAEKSCSITDRYGRNWNYARWLIEYSDEYIALFTLPTPEGCIILFDTNKTCWLEAMNYDMVKTLDFIDVSFFGKYSEWKDFLAMENISDNFKSIEILQNEADMRIKSSGYDFSAQNTLFEFDEDTNIMIDYDVFEDNSNTVWDIRKMVVSENEKNNYIVLYKNLKPDESLLEKYHTNWKNVQSLNHPFNRTPFNEDGQTNIGSIIDSENSSKRSMLFSLYISREGKVEDSVMQSALENVSVEITE